MALYSYVWPDSKSITGYSITPKVIRHLYSSGQSPDLTTANRKKLSCELIDAKNEKEVSKNEKEVTFFCLKQKKNMQ